MSEQLRKWSTITRVKAGKGLIKGCWLVDPDGVKRATIMDETLARQIASAMSLTTSKQRTNYAAELAGYKLSAKPAEDETRRTRKGRGK